jgi:hypothetical protein
MYHRLLRFALAGVCGLAIAGMILAIARATGLWLGRNTDNIWYLLKLTVPFALLLGVVAAAWPEPSAKRSGTSSFVLAALGVVLGCAYWYFVARVVGMVFLGLAIEALACWVAQAVATLLLVLSRRSYGVFASAFFICALGVVLPSPAFNMLGHNQTMTVAIVVPEELATISANPKELGFDSDSEVAESASRVLESIRGAGLGGNYRIVHLSRYGKGKQSLAILVLNARMTGRMLLAEPDATDVIYVQQPEGWTKIPAQAPTLRRNIEIWRAADHRDSLADFAIPDADGISLMVRVDEQARQ